VQRKTRSGWRTVAHVGTHRHGRYRVALGAPGLFRVKGGSVAGPAVRVR
jgi:hypothetical protein